MFVLLGGSCESKKDRVILVLAQLYQNGLSLKRASTLNNFNIEGHKMTFYNYTILANEMYVRSFFKKKKEKD